MKIRPSGTRFLATEVVQANVVRPKGIILSLNVSKVIPDVIIFDRGASFCYQPRQVK
jgi:hypothetical protein